MSNKQIIMAKKQDNNKLHNFLLEKGIEFSKELTLKATEWEKIIKNKLFKMNLNFKFQHPIIVPNGKSLKLYILDFYLPDVKLAIEIDSIKHHTSKEDKKSDVKKTRLLQKQGIYVFRLWNSQITSLTQSEFETIIRDKISLLKKVN